MATSKQGNLIYVRSLHFIFTLLALLLLPFAAQAQTSLTNGVTLNNLSGAKGSLTMYQITVPAGATNLRFATSGGGGGDLDMYAKFGALPSTTSFDAKSDGGTSTETISIAAPRAGIYYLLLHGFGAYSSVSLSATYTAPVPTPTPTPTPVPTPAPTPTPTPSPTATTLTNGVALNNLSGAKGSAMMYQIAVPAGASNLRFATTGGGGGDVDIYAKFNALPSLTSFDAKSDGGNSTETINISAPQAGTYYLLVNGFGAYSSLSLVASFSTSTATPVTLSNGVAINNISGELGSNKFFQIAIPSGASNLRFITSGGSGGDVDIYAKFSMQVSTTSYDAKSDGATRDERINVSVPQVGTYNLLLNGDTGAYAGVSLLAAYDAPPTPTPTPPPGSCNLANSTVVPAIATQAAWDQKFYGTYGSTLPHLSGNADTFAWQGHYWLRSYVSMAKTFGDTKYLDNAVRTIDYWFAHTEGAQGWGASINPSQMFLDTGVIAQAITMFSYEVWKDNRFVGYRAKADSYIARLEPILRTYNPQWVDNAPYPGSPGFYVYASCGGVCSPASLVMYNQGAAMAKALLLIDRIYRLKGLTPDAGYLHKANASAAYFKTFARLNSTGNAYVWDYGGARPNTGMEDTSHGHLDLALLMSARKFNIGGLTDTDMSRLAGTMHKILNGAAGPNDVSLRVDGSGLPAGDWDRVSVGYDWIELADYDPTLFDKTVRVFNTHMADPAGSRFYLAWAEILRKKRCVQ